MRLGIVVGKFITVLLLFIKNILFFFASLLLAMISPSAIFTLFFRLVYGHILGLYDAIGSSLELDKLACNFTLLTIIMLTWLVHFSYQFL